MVTVVLTIHVLIVIALIGVVLLQRSEGGALGMGGGGGGGGGFMTGRGAANALTRTTSILAALFFATSLGLAIFAGSDESDIERSEALTGEEIRDPNAEVTADDLFNTLGSDDDSTSEATQNPDAAPEAVGNLISDDAIDELNKAIEAVGEEAPAVNDEVSGEEVAADVDEVVDPE